MGNTEKFVSYQEPLKNGDVEKALNNRKIEVRKAIANEEVLAAFKNSTSVPIGADVSLLPDLTDFLLAYYQRDLTVALLDYAHLQVLEKAIIKPLFELGKKYSKNKTEKFCLAGSVENKEAKYSIPLNESSEDALRKLPSFQKNLNNLKIKAWEITAIFQNGEWFLDFKSTQIELLKQKNKLLEKEAKIANRGKTINFLIATLVFVFLWGLLSS